ncbi:MAG TPA: glycosyltransferase [Gemmatimonadaceae bacterium]|jgi:hypothetical protein|nr:glycosyltransferase [Gemmatimonadaceae bacterium]
MSGSGDAPALAVVIVAVTGTSSVERTMRHLRAQTARRAIEMIVVASASDAVDAAALSAGEFASFRVIPVGPILQRGAAAAIGMRAATAPIVGLVEDHSFPDPQWASALIVAHADDWAGVGPAVDNANPDSAMSWVNFILTYGIFSGTPRAGERDILPWHNSAYKRAALEPFTDRLGALLEWEGHLQEELRASGHRLYLEPAARTRHLNVSKVRSTLGLHVLRGRILGALRAERERWSYGRRVVQAAAFPLFPLLHLRYLSAAMRAMPIPNALAFRVYAGLGAALCVTAAAEAWGLLGGAGDSMARLEEYELHRTRHLARADAA